MLRKALKHYLIDNLAAVILIVFGTITWSITMVKSGLFYSFGLGFWGPNGHDGVWHIAMAEALSRGSFDIPIFAGEAIKNYHVGYDALLAVLHRITFLPTSVLYFQIIPPILALLVGVATYKFVYRWRKSRMQAFWSTFFVYFGGNFGWIVTLLREGQLGGESMFWSQQAISTLINPPFALSIVLMLLGLMLLTKHLKRPTTKFFLFVTLLFGILLQIKVYAGILSLGGLLVAGIYEFLKDKKINLLKVFGGSLLLSSLLFLLFSKSSVSLLVFQPFWFLETMMGFSDRFYWPRFAEAMVNYKLAGNLIKGIPAYTVAFFIFIIGNLGTRLVKDIWIFRKLRDFKNLYFIEIFIFSVIAAGIVLPMVFLQKGTPWNTIQFIYYSLTFSGILAGVWLGEFIEKSRLNTTLLYSIVVVIALLTIPTTIGTLRHYLPRRPPAKLSYQELGALKFLSNQPRGVVLTYPFDKDAADVAVANPPRPLYLYESTAYVSAFSGQPVYLEDEVNLDITGYDWGARREKVEEFLEARDQGLAKKFLKDNNISYIYWIKDQRAALSESELEIEKIFENKEVDIFRVN